MSFFILFLNENFLPKFNLFIFTNAKQTFLMSNQIRIEREVLIAFYTFKKFNFISIIGRIFYFLGP